MKIIKVNDRVSVAPQPDMSDFNNLKAAGFGSVINNRPDGEEPTQPAADKCARGAKTAGLRYVRQPIKLGAITEADIRQFQKELARLDGPVFAHCKSGTRSLTLWTLEEVLAGRMQASEILPFGERHGVDLKVAAKVAAKWAADRSGASDGAK
ncbi:MAG: TIGR01244 family sulfur transferase [Nitrobacter sp.]